MMRREIAYKLAGRRHRVENALEGQQGRCELRLAEPSEEIFEKALSLLSEQAGLCATCTASGCLRLEYQLSCCSLRSIEELLEQHEIALEDSVVARMKRSLTHFREDTQIRNAVSPQRLIKQSNQVYVRAYEHHSHGDHDDTPTELREIK